MPEAANTHGCGGSYASMRSPYLGILPGASAAKVGRDIHQYFDSAGYRKQPTGAAFRSKTIIRVQKVVYVIHADNLQA